MITCFLNKADARTRETNQTSTSRICNGKCLAFAWQNASELAYNINMAITNRNVTGNTV